MDNVPGPAKTIHDLQAEIDRYKAEYGELSVGVESAISAVQVSSTAGAVNLTSNAIDVTGAATPVPVSENFAGVDISAQKDTPTDAIAVLALRMNDVDQKLMDIQGRLDGAGYTGDAYDVGTAGISEIKSLVDHLFATLGFKKPDPGNG